MERLVDANAILRAHKAEQALIGNDWDIDDLATAIETAPAINAIPVKWLRKLAKHPDAYTRGCAILVLQCWRKERRSKNDKAD